MADALIASTVEVLLGKAFSLATDRIGLLFGFTKDLKALRALLSKIQAVLADAEEKQINSSRVQLWLQEVEGAAFEADIVLDELIYEDLRRQVKSLNQTDKGMKACLFFSFSKHDFSFRWRMSSKVRELNQKLEKFNNQAMEFELLIRMPDPQLPTATTMPDRQTNSLLPPFVAGRAKEESEIVAMLLGSSQQNVSVLPIVGMGGLGKTTLAKSVYNNQEIESHFNKKCWICVSDKFEVTELFKGILESLRGGKVEISGPDVIVQEIRKELDGKRFLLVLDDVWKINQELWGNFFDSLVALKSTNGSCCLLTTRLKPTADIVSTLGPYRLQRLLDEDCWSIITQKATNTNIGEEMPSELNVHKDQILKICKGLPLAAKVIGGLLRLQKRAEWPSFVENKILKLKGDLEDEIRSILKLSFDNLPSPSVKKCFAYCSVFAKDTLLRKQELVELWMAEGFLLENVEKGTTMEETGGDYFNFLLQSSLLEELNDEDFRGHYYQMHDLVHDLAESVSKPKRSRENSVILDYNYQVRYLALDSIEDGSEKVLDATSPLVRTLFLKNRLSSTFDEKLLKFKNLHVLKLESFYEGDLPSSIGKLKHLRYFYLSYSDIDVLPESLCKLYNLQTLVLDWRQNLQSLPQGMNNLISLRHLHYFTADEKFKMPPEMGRLSRLQTLKFFNIGEERGCGIEELGSMKNLKGRLHIRNLELVRDKERARQANLSGKKNLKELEFSWATTRQGVENCDEHVLEGLESHTNLKMLYINDFMGARFPQWLGKLSALVKLKLFNCKSCTEVPTLGHLPLLETLELEGLDNVSCIGDSFYGEGRATVSRRKVFPALKTLLLDRMMNLVEWKGIEVVDEGVVFPRLEELYISECFQLAITPTHFPSLKKLILEGSHVSVIENILSRSACISLEIRDCQSLTNITLEG